MPIARLNAPNFTSYLGRCRFTALLLLACSTATALHGNPPSADIGTEGLCSRGSNTDLTPVFKKLGFERRKQGMRGTCSVFTVTGALEFALARTDKPQRLSVEFLNWAANQVTGEAIDGGFFSDIWKGFAAYGVCADEMMPYRTRFDPTNRPPVEALRKAKVHLQRGLAAHWIKEWDVNTGLTEAHLHEIRKTLQEGWPVCAGLRWPKQERWQDGVLQMCAPEAVFDGHSVLLVGYREDDTQPGGGVFIFRNTSNGGRDGLMPCAYARAYMNDAMWIDRRP